MNPNAFQGCLRPEPYTFTIGVNRLIIKDDSITFDFDGVYQGERWTLHGTLEKKEGGYYHGAGRYPDYPDSRWSIWLLDASIIEGECSIEGLWFEPEDHDNDPSGGYLWPFDGLLQRLEED